MDLGQTLEGVLLDEPSRKSTFVDLVFQGHQTLTYGSTCNRCKQCSFVPKYTLKSGNSGSIKVEI